MNSYYRSIFEETAEFSDADKVVSVKKSRAKLEITIKNNLGTGHTAYSVTTKEPLFFNSAQKKTLSCELTKIIKSYFEKYDIPRAATVLVAGLGNERIAADSLGPKVCDLINAQKRASYKLCSLKCNVGGNTGIESYDLIKGITERIKPAVVIAVDTLSCSTPEKLGNTVQLYDGGLEPGGGVGNAKKTLDFDSLGVPVIAVGAPFVIYVRNILGKFGITEETPFTSDIVASKDVDFLCDDFAFAIADSVNSL